MVKTLFYQSDNDDCSIGEVICHSETLVGSDTTFKRRDISPLKMDGVLVVHLFLVPIPNPS